MGTYKVYLYDVFFLNDAHYNPVLWTIYYELIGSFIIFLLLPIVAKINGLLKKNLFYIFSILLVAFAFSPYGTLFLFGMWICDMVSFHSRFT